MPNNACIAPTSATQIASLIKATYPETTIKTANENGETDFIIPSLEAAGYKVWHSENTGFNAMFCVEKKGVRRAEVSAVLQILRSSFKSLYNYPPACVRNGDVIKAEMKFGLRTII